MDIRGARHWKTGIFAACFMAVSPLAAHADPIAVNAGTITLMKSNTASVILHGASVYVDGDVSSPAGDNYLPPNACFEPSCGMALSLSIADSVFHDDEQLGGSIIVGGVEYFLQRFSYTIDAGAVTPPPEGLSTVLLAPFTFNGSLLARHSGTSLTFDLAGHGTAHATYLANDGWLETEYSFTAAPASTPEPTSLLLLGSGAAGIIASGRRRYARPRNRLFWNP